MTETFYPIQPILLVDDQRLSLMHMEAVLKASDLNNIMQCQEARRAIDILQHQAVSCILLDLNMPSISGEELLAMIARDFPEIPVIIVTGVEEVETAVRCIKLGAFDYVVKPVEHSRLVRVVKHALMFSDLKEENLALRNCFFSGDLKNPDAFTGIITNSSRMYSLFQYAESIAPSSEPVLITGETGVGKDLMARAVHSLSKRMGDYVAVNIAGLDDNMFSDTLFGHARGAFTGAERNRNGLIEKAAGGTLFLDEIGDLTPISQAKLLRLLQEGDFLPLGEDMPKHSDARIISATNRDLWSLDKGNRFRRDLNYRLRTHHIHIPPLRERTTDIPLLVEYFVSAAAKELNKAIPTVPDKLYSLLEVYPFPGNVRELRAMVFNSVSLTNTRVLAMKAFKSHINQIQHECNMPVIATADEHKPVVFPGKLPTLKDTTELLLKEALRRANGNQSLAGRMLGISQQAVSKRLKTLEQTDIPSGE